MLKDKLSKIFTEKNKDPFNINIMDGFVNIKGYKVNKDGTKKLVYHDCGDNVVTDWMRHVIMLLLTGTPFTSKGNDETLGSPEVSTDNPTQTTMPNKNNHDGISNLDAYLLNKEQYLWDGNKINLDKYSKSYFTNKYSVFPTKVLFGTGLEYSSWDELKNANETSNVNWYNQMVKDFGGLSLAKGNFDELISKESNVLSSNGVGKKKTRTVNSPDIRLDESGSMNKRYSITGPVKTLQFKEPENSSNYFFNQGVGRPCFIYFKNQVVPGDTGKIKESWDDPASEISLGKDNSSKYLNKITFRITMPAQTNADSGKFYPYNGFSLRQIGLYNDSYCSNNSSAEGGGVGPADDNNAYINMPCGTLLAIKNISKIEKTPDLELVMTWTLTI